MFRYTNHKMAYSEDVINEKVNDICREFVASSYKDVDGIVAEFDENDKNCWFWNNPKYLWFDRHRLRQLLTYIKEHGLNNFKVNVYKTFDGGRGRTLGEMTLGSPEWNKDDLAIHIIKPTVRSGFWIEPEISSYSGGQYVCTRADIKL
jgi:hypothetical protein